jgi:hypothetical protein
MWELTPLFALRSVLRPGPACGVLLRDLIHLHDGGVDLLDAAALLHLPEVEQIPA